MCPPHGLTASSVAHTRGGLGQNLCKPSTSPLQSEVDDLGLRGGFNDTLSHTMCLHVWYSEAHIVCHCGSVLKEQEGPTVCHTLGWNLGTRNQETN